MNKIGPEPDVEYYGEKKFKCLMAHNSFVPFKAQGNSHNLH